ncbi:unnamed protein product [Clonostachys rosea f. rosea IK726]|uniref:Uncharacterized protein n=1 Tax=Clonostachys rosea f. rosea IK726 TaxID=1349383 RepID=A0ACA9UJU7_BIOOC|nr:unnamed protein product [Clonostachys rosea f. rosea IK726]
MYRKQNCCQVPAALQHLSRLYSPLVFLLLIGSTQIHIEIIRLINTLHDVKRTATITITVINNQLQAMGSHTRPSAGCSSTSRTKRKRKTPAEPQQAQAEEKIAFWRSRLEGAEKAAELATVRILH